MIKICTSLVIRQAHTMAHHLILKHTNRILNHYHRRLYTHLSEINCVMIYSYPANLERYIMCGCSSDPRPEKFPISSYCPFFTLFPVFIRLAPFLCGRVRGLAVSIHLRHIEGLRELGILSAKVFI